MKPALRKSLVSIAVVTLLSSAPGVHASLTGEQAAAAQAGAVTSLPPKRAIAGELLVKYKSTVPDATRVSKHNNKGHGRMRQFKAAKIDHVSLPPGKSLLEAINEYRNDPDVEYVQPNYVMDSALTPTEVSFGLFQWGLNNTQQFGGVLGADIRALTAWDITTGSPDVVVAVIDSGIDYNHQDLAVNTWDNLAEKNGLPGVDDDGNGFVDDIHGIDTLNNDSDPFDDNTHGTQVSGIIGAAANNALGIAGVAWNVKMMPCKFSGTATSSSGPLSGALACMDYVQLMKSRGVNIVAINASFGGIGAADPAMRDTINTMRDTLFVAAAGNFFADNDQAATAFYPASFDLPNIISVAATNPSDNKSTFSHFGRRTVHLGAPGESIYTTNPFSEYTFAAGTSAAAPHVTGVIALLKAQNPTRDWKTLKNLVLASTDAKTSLGGRTITGGRLNAFTALGCTNRPLMSALKVPTAATIGQPTVLSAISINCGAPVGPVTATPSNGQAAVTLVDNGIAPDLAAGDGIFTGTFTPTSNFASVVYQSAAGIETVGMPDLSVSGVTGPSFVELGAALTVSANVNNLGAIGSGTSVVRFLLSSNAAYDPALDIPLGDVAVPAVAAGGTVPINALLAVPPTVVSGNYHVVAVVDPAGQMIEADETNNAASTGTPMLVGSPPTDLVVSAVTAPAGGTRGNPISVSATVANTGTQSAAASQVQFFMQSSLGVRTTLGTAAMPATQGGLSQVVSGSFAVPPALANGSYFVGATADTLNTVIETNEGNNTLVSPTATTVSTLSVDLNFTGMSAPTSARVGQNVSLSATLKNSGTATANVPQVQFVISPNTTIGDADDVPMGTVGTANLAGNSSRTVSASLPIPGTLAAGTYYFGVRADPNNLIVETNEANNTRRSNSSVSVTVAADLTMLAPVTAPATAVTGQTIAVSGTVKNQGTAAINTPFRVGFYLSSDASITTGDRLLGFATVNSLANGISTPVSGSFVIPTNLTPGTWRIGAIADYNTLIRESNENNNALVGNSMVIGIGPDLIVSALSAPATGTAGTAITANATVTNQGVGLAEVLDPAGNKGTTKLKFYLSTDAVINSADTFIGSVTIPSLANGQSTTISVPLTIPSTLRGTYYIGAIADADNDLLEANESNNTRAGNTVVISVDGSMLLMTVTVP